MAHCMSVQHLGRLLYRRKNDGEYIEDKIVLLSVAVNPDEGYVRSKKRPSIGETNENVFEPDRTWYIFSNLFLALIS